MEMVLKRSFKCNFNIAAYALYRCWRVLRSWTTACCWVCTSWTRAREKAGSRAKQGGTGGGLWVRGCFTPPPWSPSKETARLLRLSPQTTREWAQLGKTHILCTHIWAYTLCLCLLNSTFSLTDTVIQPCSYLTQDAQTVYTQSYNHSYTNTNTATVARIYSHTHKCKYCKWLFHKHLSSGSSVAEEEQ